MEIQGRVSNFEQVMLPHLDAAYNLARRLVRDPSIAEDVVQDAYERACKYFAAFRGGSGRAWLLQIVRNAAYSTLKTQRRRMEVSLSSGMLAADEAGVDMDIPDSSPGPEATLAQRQDLATLDDALNALPAAWRESLILRDVETLSYKGIAQIMDVPIGTVMSRLSRARQALQRVVVRDDQQGSSPRTASGSSRLRSLGSSTRVNSAWTSPSTLTARHDKEQRLLPNLFARKPLDKRR
jgi:RNA polymerase sigma factor (sigma-70 family)